MGSCSGGGWFGGKDCPGGDVHKLKCCAIPDFLSAFWSEYYSEHGVPLDCRDHPSRPILVGQCHSGANHDCSNAGNMVDCAEGYLDGRRVGPTNQGSLHFFNSEKVHKGGGWGLSPDFFLCFVVFFLLKKKVVGGVKKSRVQTRN